MSDSLSEIPKGKRRTLRIDIEIVDPTETPESTDKLLDAIADYVAREWNANVATNMVYDSDGDPIYQQEYNQ